MVKTISILVATIINLVKTLILIVKTMIWAVKIGKDIGVEKAHSSYWGQLHSHILYV